MCASPMYASVWAFAIHLQNFKNDITIDTLVLHCTYNAIFTNNAAKLNSLHYYTPRVAT